MLLSEFLKKLNFAAAKKSSDYVGTKLQNPAILLEDNVPVWTKTTSLDDLLDCMTVFTENVCVSDFPARFSPQFWLAHSALSTIYTVLCGYVEAQQDTEIQKAADEMLFNLWIKLIAAGPGSSHLEMMAIILKNDLAPLWKYMQGLRGEDLKLLVYTLRTDFVYQEEVTADHYATLMETHIDKVFKLILTDRQIEASRRELLALYQYYLGRLNHVPPHIGPRLSHLCFLICNRFHKENPYAGLNDWVVMRTHLKTVQDIITHPSFTKASEAQYRVPFTLEKIFQAAIMDGILNIMFKDFMSLLIIICSHEKSAKCDRLFIAYETALFDLIDFKKGFEETPYWMFDQCIQAMTKVAKSLKMEPHIDNLIVTAQTKCLLKFTKLTGAQLCMWHDLILNYLISGRQLLVYQAAQLLTSPVLIENKVFQWKNYADEGRQWVDIVKDMPPEFMEKLEDQSHSLTLRAYSQFMAAFLAQLKEQNLQSRVRDSIQQCVLACTQKFSRLKAPIALTCLQSEIADLKDASFMQEALFTIEATFKEEGCPQFNTAFTEVVYMLLQASLAIFRQKGYVPIDMNSLLMSIAVSSLTLCSEKCSLIVKKDVCSTPQEPYPHAMCVDSAVCEVPLFDKVVADVIQPFIQMHLVKGTRHAVAPLLPQLLQNLQDCAQRHADVPDRCWVWLEGLALTDIGLVDHLTSELVQLYLDSDNHDMDGLLTVLLKHDAQPYVAGFPVLFQKVLAIENAFKHKGMGLLSMLANLQPQIFSSLHVCQLLGIYPSETAATQMLILDTVTCVARHAPGHVASYFNILLDDHRFPPASLQQRVPLFRLMCRHSEDLLTRTVEHLIKHLGDQDQSVTSVAMETLKPLLADKPSLLQKNRAKLTEVWKKSPHADVKEIIINMLPDVNSTKKRPTQAVPPKQQRNSVTSIQPREKPRSSTAVNTKPSGTGASKNQRTAVSTTSTVIKVAAAGKSTTAHNLTNTSKSRSSSANKVNSVTCIQTVPEYVQENHPQETLVQDRSSGISASDENGKNSDADISSSVVRQDKVYPSDTVGDCLQKELTKPVTAGHDFKDSGQATIKNPDNSQYLSASSETIKTNGKQESQSTVCSDSDNIKYDGEKTGFNEERQELALKSINQEPVSKAQSNQDNQAKEFNVELCKIESSALLLCGPASRSQDLIQLRECLLSAGINSDLCCVRDIQDCVPSIKVILFACSADDTEYELDIIKLLSAENTQSAQKILIILKKDDLASYLLNKDTLQHSRTFQSIQLFNNSSTEKCLKGTCFSCSKFRQLLMVLNYYGLIWNQDLITEEMKVLLGKPEVEDKVMTYEIVPSSTEAPSTDTERQARTSTGYSYTLPDVYFSYDWAEHDQVLPLYQHLQKQGFHCWFSGLEMSGSESLYNRITTGLQSCRVVLACLTSNYHESAVCCRDIATAQSLRRPVISLAFGPVKQLFSRSDFSKSTGVKDTVERLKQYEWIDIDSSCNETVNVHCEGVDKLCRKLREILKISDGNKTQNKLQKDSNTSENKEARAVLVQTDNQDEDKSEPKITETRKKHHANRALSLYDVHKHSLVADSAHVERSMTSEDLYRKRHSLQTGMMVDRDSYQFGSDRSKSCIVL